MTPIRSGFYPVVIHETRYGGVYSHGKWALIAGIYSVDARTDAFASDGPCQRFWNRVRNEGPIISIPYRGELYDEQDIYVASGDDPNELLDEFLAATEE